MQKHIKKLALFTFLTMLSVGSYASHALATGQAGICGSDHGGGTFSSAPSNKASMCARGQASTATVSGSSWVWTCTGSGTSATANCSTAYCSSAVDGVCGSADGSQMTSAPSGSQLCASGNASSVTGTGPWSWTCNGISGGATVSCTALTCAAGTPAVNGYCGGADGQYFSSAAEVNAAGLCNPGDPSPVSVSGAGPWSWSCAGYNGGSSMSCAAGVATTTNGACRVYGGSYPAQPGTTTATGCTGGTYQDTSDTSSHWVWRCMGTGSPAGTNATCSEAKEVTVNGQCKTFSGEFASQPATNTATGCATGTYTDVTDTSAQWKWDCAGSGTGITSQCAASKILVVNGACQTYGSSYDVQPASDDTSGCTAGTYADAADSGTQWQWTCNGQGGGANASCAADIQTVGCTLGAEYVFNDWDGWAGDMASPGPNNYCQGSNYIGTEYGGTGTLANLKGTCGSNTTGYFNANGGDCFTRVTANCGNNLNCATFCQVYARGCQ